MQIKRLKGVIRRSAILRPVVRRGRALRAAMRRRRAVARDLPETISIELTNECNLKCAKCPTYDAKRTRGMMEPSLFQKILDDVSGARATTSLALSGGGESVLHGGLVDFVHRAVRVANVRTVGFATNGLGLDPDLSRALLQAGLGNLKVSLDAVDRGAYLKMNRVDGYELAVRNVKEFCRLVQAGNYDCPVTLKVTLYKEDDVLIPRIREIWSDDVDHIRVTGLHNWTGLRGKRQGAARDSACSHLWDMIQILWNGQITLCCFDSMEGFYNMGNAREVNITDYWTRGPGLSRIRALHLARDFTTLPVCAACNEDQYETRHYFSVSRRQPAAAVDEADW